MIPSGDEGARRAEEKGSFVFRLYVVNEGPGSARAIANLSAICKKHLPDNHQIEIVDLLQDPRRVLSDKIVATPTLIKAESLLSLGLYQLLNVRVSAIREDGQALPIPLKEEDCTARAETTLEAHEALIKTASENLPKFKDLIQYLKEELHPPK